MATQHCRYAHVVCVWFALMAAACERHAPVLSVMAAPSLVTELTPVIAEFEATNPGVEVQVEWVGSVLACRHAQQGDRPVDVLVVADAELVRTLLPPSAVSSHELLQYG